MSRGVDTAAATEDMEVSGVMRINQNIAAFNAYRNLSQTQSRLSGTLEKLSSGFRINRAADDASGLVNSENLRAQIGGLKVATRNAQDAISMVQTAEGAQTEVHSILQRMRDLVVEAGNVGVNDAEALKANQDEISQLQNELNRINEETQFGTRKIFTEFAAPAEEVGSAGAVSNGNGPTSYDPFEPVNGVATPFLLVEPMPSPWSVTFAVDGATYTAAISPSITGSLDNWPDFLDALNTAATSPGGTQLQGSPWSREVTSENEDGVLTFTDLSAPEVRGSFSVGVDEAVGLGLMLFVSATAENDADTITLQGLTAIDFEDFGADGIQFALFEVSLDPPIRWG